MSIEEWVQENVEKVQSMRDRASAKYREVSAETERVNHFLVFHQTQTSNV